MALQTVHIYFSKLHGLDDAALFETLWTRLEGEADITEDSESKTMEVTVRNPTDFRLGFTDGEWEDRTYFADEIDLVKEEGEVFFDKDTGNLRVTRKKKW